MLLSAEVLAQEASSICTVFKEELITFPVPVKKHLESEVYWCRTEAAFALEEVKFLAFQMLSLQILGDAVLSRGLSFLLDVHPQKELHAYTMCNQWSRTKQGVTQFAKANALGSYHLNYLLSVSV